MTGKNLSEFYTAYHREKKKYNRKTGGKIRITLINTIIGTGKKVLDLGCRDGTFTQFILNGNHVVGVDIDDIALSICKDNFGIETAQADLNGTLPFRDSTFDVVFAGELIEHLVIPEYFLREVQRVLKKGGIFCGTTPNAYRLKTRLRFLMGKDLCGDPTHLRFFSYDTLNFLLSKYFREIKTIPFHGHIIGNYKRGILVTPNTPLFLGKLFSRHFLWKAVKNDRGPV